MCTLNGSIESILESLAVCTLNLARELMLVVKSHGKITQSLAVPTLNGLHDALLVQAVQNNPISRHV